MIKKLLSILLLLLLLPIPAKASTYSDYTNREYTHDKRFDDCIIINGVDASTFQDASSDWKKAKENGIDFAIFRVTLTKANSGSLEVDDEFEEHYNKAGDAGIMRGVYVFSQALNAEEGKKEAEFAIKRLKELGITPEKLDLPVYMDYEFFHKESSRLKNLSADNAIAAAESFCETIKDSGYRPGVYANTSFFAAYLDNGETLPEDVSIWCAQYNTRNDSGCDYEIWQYSSTGTVPDIYEAGGGKLDGVDVDFWYVSTEMEEDTNLSIFTNSNVEYTGNPVLPEVEVYDGDKPLKENKDYVVKGINNIEKGAEAYAYIRGVGKYDGYALVPINIGEKFVKLSLPASIIESSFKVSSNKSGSYISVPDEITVKELLENTKLTSEEYSLSVINSEGNILMEDENVIFSDMLGVFNDTTLVGTIDINMDCENKINHLKKK